MLLRGSQLLQELEKVYEGSIDPLKAMEVERDHIDLSSALVLFSTDPVSRFPHLSGPQ